VALSTRALLAASLLLCASTATAAAGFIAGSHVEKGNLYTSVTIRFRCKVHYLGHDPSGKTDILRVRLEATSVCAGASPEIANNRELHRPPSADDARIDSIEYEGENSGDQHLRLNFTEEVAFRITSSSSGDAITVQVFDNARPEPDRPTQADSQTRLSRRPEKPSPKYVINLESSLRPPATADLPGLALTGEQELFVATAMIDGQTWYRVRVGYFGSAEEAARQLRTLRAQFPGAWIGTAKEAPEDITRISPVATRPESRASDVPLDKTDTLMRDAHRAMTAGEISRAVQIYTKVLQLPAHEGQREAQEFLALARERNGQIAHAKAEYQRYLDLYPDGEGAQRVQQRLASLLASNGGRTAQTAGSAQASARSSASKTPSAWRLRTFLSQRYRRDVNQVNDEDEVVNQSSIYTDLSIDARRRGERFDFASRITAGHRTDLLSESQGSGNDFRLAYAYADLSDSRTGLRGRVGRQTRTGGGVLGRFDGLNMSYSPTDTLRFDAVTGKPVFSTGDGVDDLRTFYGLSATYGPIADNLDIGAFVLQQDIDGTTDRQAVGGEIRYSGENRTLWGMFDYDTEFKELGSGFVQGTVRLPANFTITGLLDRRRSPYLSVGNALIGQQDQDFRNLRLLFTEDEIRQFALDRSAPTTTMTLGLSRPLSPRLQFGFNATRSEVEATTESAGIAAMPASTYSYYSVDLVASSLFTQGDVGIISLRHAETSTTNIETLSLDSRFPIGRAWRINGRLRVDYRRILSDMSEEWTYTPGLRLQYRPTRKLRLELEAGKRFSSRTMETADLDRESYFVNLGYQFFY
jgi:hypothetical protein